MPSKLLPDATPAGSGRLRRWAQALVLVLTAGVVGSRSPLAEAQPARFGAPLFSADSLVALALTLDLRDVARDRSDDPPDYPATLSYVAADGTPVRLDAGVRTRGFFRLRHLDCDIPPLRLNLKKGQVPGTLFEGQDKLKLVTHCQNGQDRFERYVLLERLLYEAYALFTDLSFRTRLVRVTYVDRAGRRDPVSGVGFLIEHEDAMAARNGGAIVEAARVHPEATDREAATRLALFNYMVGNTDWGVWDRHNMKLVFLENEGTLVAVPYDFDWAGLIDTHYATPSENLGLRSVRQRRFLGYCRSEAEFARALAEFADREQALYALFRDAPYLDADAAEDAIAYLAEFFDALRDRDRLLRALRRECLAGRGE